MTVSKFVETNFPWDSSIFSALLRFRFFHISDPSYAKFSADPDELYRITRLRLAFQAFCFLMELHRGLDGRRFIRHMRDSRGVLPVRRTSLDAMHEYRCLMEKAWATLPSTMVAHGLERPEQEDWAVLVSRC